jgi:hypothetical protein
MKFCGVCKHDYPGHEPNCPVHTREVQQGFVLPGAVASNVQGVMPPVYPDGPDEPGYAPGNDPTLSVIDVSILAQLRQIQNDIHVIRYELQVIKKFLEL